MPARGYYRSAGLTPLHGLLLAFPVALFTGTVATDITYLNTGEMQWTNFSAWLNAAAKSREISVRTFCACP